MFHGVERGRKVAKRHLLPDDRAELARGEQGQQLGVQVLTVAMSREVEATQSLEHHRVIDVGVAHADEREVPEQHRPRHQPLVFLLDTRCEAGEDVAPVERHAAERLQRHVAAHRVERDVDPPAVRRLERRVGEVDFAVVDREVGAELEDEGLVPRPVLFGNFSLVGVCHAYVDDPVVFKQMTGGFNFPSHHDGEKLHAELMALFAAGTLRAIVGQAVTFDEIPGALDAIEQRKTIGRTVARLS